MAPPKKTLYQVLGVSREASAGDIGLAYEMRSAEMQHAVPPDPSGIALVRGAYEVLSDPQRRAAYDASLLTAAEREAASASAQSPDLEIEPEGSGPDRPRRLILMIAGMALVMFALFMAFRPRGPGKAPAPPPAPTAEAPKPAPPAPPKPRTGSEILADASAAGGQLLAYAMSGRARPIGMALSLEPGTMVTTCHGIPAGDKLVVKVGPEHHAADLNLTDEVLDLCRLALPGFGTPPIKVSTELPKPGDRVFAVGMTAQGEMAATEGTVTQLHATPQGNVIGISVPVAPTASGGGVFDTQGRLIGITTTPHRLGPGLNIALPAAWIAEMRSRTLAAQ